MPLEKQNKKKQKKTEKRKRHMEREGGKRERNDRLDSKEEIKRCSHLLERYLCKTSGEITDIQNCRWWRRRDLCLPPLPCS